MPRAQRGKRGHVTAQPAAVGNYAGPRRASLASASIPDRHLIANPSDARHLAKRESPIAGLRHSGLRQHAVTGMLTALDTRKPLYR